MSAVSSSQPVQAGVEVTRVGPGSAATVLEIVRAAFGARPPLDPPADALGETEQTMAERLAAYGGLLATLDGEPVGALVLDPVGRTMYLRRFAVLPDRQGHGIAHAMVGAAVAAASEGGFEDLTVVAREELPRTVRFWTRQGFREIARRSPSVELRRPLRTLVVEVPTAEEMQALGARLAEQLRAGDLLVLSGELGAGKTTFTQGLGAGLGVRAGITSPTFVISRVHPSEVGGPALIHVDAYRLGGLAELDDLDLDTDLEDAVTVVEWGEGIAEGLSDSRLEVRIVRALADEGGLDQGGLDTASPGGSAGSTTDQAGSGGDDAGSTTDAAGSGGELDPRRVEITPVGPRWHDLSFQGLPG